MLSCEEPGLKKLAPDMGLAPLPRFNLLITNVGYQRGTDNLRAFESFSLLLRKALLNSNADLGAKLAFLCDFIYKKKRFF
jgi:hypothetical protein